MTLKPRTYNPDQPLVSILIYNYNYGRYLRECFDSVLAQTYENIEILFSDNASTDESWDIAIEYQRKYPDVFFVARNRSNFGSDANLRNCSMNLRGKYFVNLCSDDALLPEFTSTCVRALEANTDTAFAMVHRRIINQDGKHVDEAPFYDRDCKIPGAAQAAVYMMAAVNPAISQIMYRKSYVYNKGVIGGLAARWYGTRMMDFNICCEYPILYFKDPLMLHRMHAANDSARAADTLLEIMGPYILNHQYVEMASFYDHQNVIERLPAATEKIGYLSIRYCVRALLDGNERTARRYWYLAAALFPDIVETQEFRSLERYWGAPPEERCHLLSQLEEQAQLVNRTKSYEPPPGSEQIRS